DRGGEPRANDLSGWHLSSVRDASPLSQQVVDRSRQGRAEAGDVGAASLLARAVGEGPRPFCWSVQPPKCHTGAPHFSFHTAMHDAGMDGLSPLGRQGGKILLDPVSREEGRLTRRADTVIGEPDFEPRVQMAEVPEPLEQGVEGEVPRLCEDLWIGPEGDRCAGDVHRPGELMWRCGFAPSELL